MINNQAGKVQFGLGKFMLLVSNHLLALQELKNGFQEEIIFQETEDKLSL